MMVMKWRTDPYQANGILILGFASDNLAGGLELSRILYTVLHDSDEAHHA